MGAISFDLVLLAFTGALVLTALLEPNSDAHLVPLVVGVPTLLGVVGILVGDLFPDALTRVRRGGDALRSAAQAPEREEGRRTCDQSAGEQTGADALQRGGADGPDDHTAGAREPNRRRAIFAVWACGFFALTAIFGLLASIPIALAVLLRFGNRESWPVTVGLTIGVWLFVYVLFGLLLGDAVVARWTFYEWSSLVRR
ncbi:MAG: tripartite tricarboxylate transporter TctB family protein [Streptomycetales bacterium]